MSGRVLIVDDTATNRIGLKARLADACYEVVQAASGAEALIAARREAPDVILLAADMPGMDGVETCAALKADPAARHIPVVMLTGRADRTAHLRGLAAGADEFLVRPVDDLALLARLRNLLREKAMIDELQLRAQTCRALGLAEPAAAPPLPEALPRIEVICTDPRRCHALRRIVRDGFDAAIDCLAPRRALGPRNSGTSPDLVIVAPGPGNGDDLLAMLPDLRSRPVTRAASILAVLPPSVPGLGVAVLDLGANDYVAHDVDHEELALRLRGLIRRKRYSDRLRTELADGLRMAVTDPLTGLYNRRYAQHHLDQIAARAARSGGSYAVMLLDIDRFKAINDSYGHAAGDFVLAEVARRLRDNLRGVDLLSRHGGEEFLAALPDTTAGEARIAAERLRAIVADTPFVPPGAAPIAVTLSVGVAMGGPGPSPIGQVLAAADRALYDSKHDGRNLVTFARSAA
jgi:two-component system, cell cycle response regulator